MLWIEPKKKENVCRVIRKQLDRIQDMIELADPQNRSLLHLCPVSHYEGVLFPFVNNLNIFNSLLAYISPLKVLCIYCGVFCLFVFGFVFWLPL